MPDSKKSWPGTSYQKQADPSFILPSPWLFSLPAAKSTENPAMLRTQLWLYF